MSMNLTCACYRCYRSVNDDGTCFYLECPRCDYGKLFCSPVHRAEHEAWHNRRCSEQHPNQAIAELAVPATASPENSEAGLLQQSPDSGKSASAENDNDASASELSAEMKHRLSLLDLSGDEADSADEKEGDSFREHDNSDEYESDNDDGESHEECHRKKLKQSKGKGNGKGKEVNMEEGGTEIEANGPSPASQQFKAFDSDDEYIGLSEVIAASRLQQEQDNSNLPGESRPESSRAAQARYQNCRSSFSWDMPESEGDLYDVSSDEERRQRGPQTSRVHATDQVGEQIEDHDENMGAPTREHEAVEEFGSSNSVDTSAVVNAVEDSRNIVAQLEWNSENTTLTDNDSLNEAAVVDDEHTFADTDPSNTTMPTEPAASSNYMNLENRIVQDKSRAQHQEENQGEQQGVGEDGGFGDGAGEDADDEMERGRDEGEDGAGGEYSGEHVQREQGS